MDLDWLIIGGGIHGVHVAARLVMEGGVDLGRLQIVDPEVRLQERWRARTAATGMEYLRSPVMHHVDIEPYALQDFAEARDGGEAALFIKPNDRPSLSLFNAHCGHVVQRLGLEDRHVCDHVTDIALLPDGVSVQLASGSPVTARRIVLAIGEGQSLHWPHWAPKGDPRAFHVFSRDLDVHRWAPQAVCVVGAGLSAAQIALQLVDLGHRVTLLSRQPLSVHQYDSEPGWFGPKFMDGFEKIVSLEMRRRVIKDARNRGSITPGIHMALQQAMESGALTFRDADVESLDSGGSRLELVLKTRERLHADRLICATGFPGQRPGGEMLDRLIQKESLPVSACGFPIVDHALRWHSRVHVSGALAELELGPVAKNIAGARRTGERILTAV